MVEFSKLEGTGNDFLIFDNRKKRLSDFLNSISLSLEKFIAKVCDRKKGVGADGFIIVENSDSDSVDFKWRFFNSDGSKAEMCGNGARCAARFAFEKGIADKSLKFETDAGIIEASVNGKEVKVLLTEPKDLNLNIGLDDLPVTGHFINTGVPHFVIFVDDIESIDVEKTGRKIRFHERFSPKGTNVNFASFKDGKLYVRTYERGVEGETLACGTGLVAAALIFSKIFSEKSPIAVVVRSGEHLQVDFDASFKRVFLTGGATYVFEGSLRREIFE